MRLGAQADEENILRAPCLGRTFQQMAEDLSKPPAAQEDQTAGTAGIHQAARTALPLACR